MRNFYSFVNNKKTKSLSLWEAARLIGWAPETLERKTAEGKVRADRVMLASGKFGYFYRPEYLRDFHAGYPWRWV